MTTANRMQGINSYGRQLSPGSIDNNEHRAFIGGMWDEIGQLQYDFMRQQGLAPAHTLLDIGCGCLRGGLHFIDYLEAGNYYGVDINNSLIEAAQRETEQAGLAPKQPHLLVDDQFRLETFGTRFDYMLSISLFTHLPMNIIIRCMTRAAQCLKPEGAYFATFFQAPRGGHLDDLQHEPGNITTHYDADPYHYAFEELAWMAATAGLEARLVDNFDHPRNQKMAAFTLRHT